MLKYLLLFLLVFAGLTSSLLAQQRVVSGILTDETGAPLPGVNIIIKGTSTGTVTDIDGRYSIEASIGQILVFSFIGFTPYEVVVSATNSQPAGQQINSSQQREPGRQSRLITDPEQERRGVARMREKSPGFLLKSRGIHISGLPAGNMIGNAYTIRYLSPRWASLRYGKAGKEGMFIIEDRFPSSNPLQIEFTSALTIDKAYQLPALQDQYAQGRPLAGTESWQGPETGEIFSWGPKLTNLEYDGQAYPYHKQGKLVSKGTGNGQQADKYNPYSFFQTGITSDNSLRLHKSFGETSLDMGLQRKQQRYIVPNSGYSRDNFNFSVHTPIFYRLEAQYSFYYSEAKGDLLQRGANMASIFSGILRTPPSFDNAAGFSSKQAVNNKQAYTLENALPRSSSVHNTDNPYWLINTMPDQEQLKTVLSSLQLKYSPWYNFSIKANLGIDQQQSRYISGIAPFSAGSYLGRITNRSDRQTTFHSILTPSFRKDFGNFYIDASTTYDLSFTGRNLQRTDAFGFSGNQYDLSHAESTHETAIKQHRLQHDWMTIVNLRYLQTINLKLSNQSYFSSTLSETKAFLPGAGLGIVFSNIGPLQNSSLLRYGRLFASYAQSVKEAPLLYSKWHFNSTILPLANYLTYFEAQEIAFNKRLKPEQYFKWEYGAALSLFDSRIGVEMLYFNKQIKQALVPIANNGQFNLINGASIHNKGYELSLQYLVQAAAIHWTPKLHFTRFTPLVTEVYGPEKRIPLAGFTEVSTNLAEGQAYGVIYGNTYLRSQDGQYIIGPNGFPLVDQELKPIGNPNPDWVAALENKFRWKFLDLAFVVDIRKGGDVWNGTSHALDYFGLSKRTQAGREIRNYIFEGVRADGQENTQPVDFANPASGLAGNRWVQYGMAGVAEEAIEDGSWIRLNEVKLSCRIHDLLPSLLRRPQIDLSLIGKNLLLLTRYSGVDPATGLFGYEPASGLDFFNMPATRSYGIALTIKH